MKTFLREEEKSVGYTERKQLNQYNLAMKKILPQYDIKLVEIPRKSIDGKYISGSSVRRYMKENSRDKLEGLLPETTREILGI